MKNFLFNFNTKPSLVTLFIIIGFFYCLGYGFYYFVVDTNYFSAISGMISIGAALGLMLVYILYRFIIKDFKTKPIFIFESALTVFCCLIYLVNFLIHSHRLIIDLSNYSENYFLIVEEDGEQKNTDTHTSPFLLNDRAVLHENYFVLNSELMYGSEIMYPDHWQVSDKDLHDEDRTDEAPYFAYLRIDPFAVNIYYNDTFDFSPRTFDSLATLVIYARQHDIPVAQADIELSHVWTEINYLNTTPLEPYVINSTVYLNYRYSEDKGWISYEEWESQSEPASPSDSGILLSYTSYERIIEDMKGRAERNNWPEQTLVELMEYYTSRMPGGYFRIHIERPTEELANSARFYINSDHGFHRTLQPKSPSPSLDSDSGNWTNTLIIPIWSTPDSTFQVTITEKFGIEDQSDSFIFDMKKN